MDANVTLRNALVMTERVQVRTSHKDLSYAVVGARKQKADRCRVEGCLWIAVKASHRAATSSLDQDSISTFAGNGRSE